MVTVPRGVSEPILFANGQGWSDEVPKKLLLHWTDDSVMVRFGAAWPISRDVALWMEKLC